MANGSRRQAGRQAKDGAPDERRSAVTRAQILGGVYDLISQYGIESLTMRQVSEFCGISTGTINYHFKNKSNLLAAALEEAYHLPADWDSYRGSPEAQLRRIAASHVLRGKTDRWWFFWLNYLAYSTRDADVQAHQNVRYTKQLRFWAHLISDGVSKGEFRADLDPFATARHLLTMVHGLVILQVTQNEPETRAYARDQISQAIDALKAV